MVARLVPAVVVVAAGFYLLQALKLPLGTVARPGAGFFPVAVGVFACIVGLMAMAQAFARPRGPERPAEADPDAAIVRRRVSTTTLAVAGFCLAMPWVGYPVAAAAFVIAMLIGLGSRWPAAVAIGAVSAAASYGLFGGVLDVPQPRGPW
jgi:hypothetical protein